jgi:antirestriction protein ArdC
MNNPQTSIYEEITERIITALEDGVNPWAKPWQAANSETFRNALTNRSYRGMTVLLLNLMALFRGHVDPRWLTYRNAEQLAGHVCKGEKGASIVFWKFLPARGCDGDAEADAFTDDEQQRRLIPLARIYAVFNAELDELELRAEQLRRKGSDFYTAREKKRMHYEADMMSKNRMGNYTAMLERRGK